MALSIIILALATAMLAYWIRVSYRLLKESTQAEETAAVYERSFERASIRASGSLTRPLPEGGTASMPMTGVNMSRGGALVEAKEALPIGSVVLIHFASLRTMTTATVRHCTPRGSGFRIGVEFRHPLMAAHGGTWEIVLEPVV